MIEISSDEEETLRLVQQALAQGVRRAIVIPYEGRVLVVTDAYIYSVFTYSEDEANRPQAIAAILQGLGFFTPDMPPVTVPSELTTPTKDRNLQYLVEKTLVPQATVHHLIK
jgi:thymidylate kinase